MIKIEIPNKQIKMSEYLSAVKPIVKERIELLIISTKHLRGDALNTKEGDITKYKFVTCKIINELTAGNKIDESEFAKHKYVNKVTDCLETRKPKSDLDRVNFGGILELLNDLLDSGEELLEKLLVCEANNLKKENDRILTQYNLDTPANRYFIKRGFDYSSPDVGDAIKSFFRSNNFVHFCPYCNITETLYSSSGGRAATTHQLDHFFDKARFPLLACSFFNLIPSDGTCNGSDNKGTIQFTDEYHLNPYIAGFGKNLLFEPILRGRDVKAVRLNITVAKGTRLRQQLLGSTEEIMEYNMGNNEHKEGNINVFMIKTKYSNRQSQAQDVLNDIYKVDNGMRSIKKILGRISGLDLDKTYMAWYNATIKTPFKEESFNDRAFSKFNRDIHDYYYYNLDKRVRNNYIRSLIQ